MLVMKLAIWFQTNKENMLKTQILTTAFVFVVMLFTTLFVMGNTRVDLRSASIQKTLVTGLKPGSEVSYTIISSSSDNKQASSKEVLRNTLIVRDDGSVNLPMFKPDYQSYNISIEDEKKPIVLNVTYNRKTGRFNMKGSGFEKFTDVFIQTGSGSESTKTDWAGLFSETQTLTSQDFGEGEQIKLAFNGFTLDGDMLGQNPLQIQVVIGQGGGPTNADVNVYNPRIHEYNCGEPIFSTDGDDTFYVSTCDGARMQLMMNDGQCTGGPICTSSADTFEQLIVHPLMLMAEQLSAVMMQQMGILGSLMDAKEQNEVQRDINHMKAQAHKDYHPSEQMCRFGSYIRSLSHAEENAEATKKSFNRILSYYANSADNMSSSEGYALDVESRLEQFKDHYCDPNDNNAALWMMCRGERITLPPPAAGTGPERERYNKDIDYFRTFDRPLTFDVNMLNAVASNDEEDLIALAKNLYWPVIENLAPMEEYEAAFQDNYGLLLKARNVVGKISLAHNSFAHIAGMKSSSASLLAADSGGAHLKALLREFGLTDPDIEVLVGANPSYYAQMEILAKKIYQNPTFYTNLYDKPVNIDRINASLEAFQNMHMRDRYESQLRQEMLISMLVEDAIMERVDEVNAKVPFALSTTVEPQQGTGF